MEDNESGLCKDPYPTYWWRYEWQRNPGMRVGQWQAYVGITILDLSKTLMYDVHYNYIKQKSGNKAELLFTDTDSLTYEIETEDVYQGFWNDRDKFDSNGYPENCPYFDKTDKKVITKFKDEACSISNQWICWFKIKNQKLYIKDDNEGCKIAKGVKTNVIKKNVKYEDYINVLLNNKQLPHKLKNIQSNNHQLGSYEQSKVSLSCSDDKRYIHEDDITSYAYGHYKIQKHHLLF